MNRGTLIGRLTKDMEVRTSESGNTIGVFTIAVNRPYKKEDGQNGWLKGERYVSGNFTTTYVWRYR